VTSGGGGDGEEEEEGEINFAKLIGSSFGLGKPVARLSRVRVAAHSRFQLCARLDVSSSTRPNLIQLSRFDDGGSGGGGGGGATPRSNISISRFISREIEITGGLFRYCSVNHNSRSFIQFRLLACMRAAWNRRSPPEISRRVANCPRKITGSYVYSICRLADAGIGVLSRACPDKMRGDPPPCGLSPRIPRTRDIAPRTRRGIDAESTPFQSMPGDATSLLLPVPLNGRLFNNHDAPHAPFSPLVFLSRARARARACV